MTTRKTISDKDQKWMNKLTDKINKLYPNAVSPFDHLQLMQELVRLRPGFEITSSKEYKRVFEWAFISGYFCAIQNEILKSEKKSAIKGFLQTDFIRRQKKELEEQDKSKLQPPDHNKGI